MFACFGIWFFPSLPPPGERAGGRGAPQAPPRSGLGPSSRRASSTGSLPRPRLAEISSPPPPGAPHDCTTSDRTGTWDGHLGRAPGTGTWDRTGTWDGNLGPDRNLGREPGTWDRDLGREPGTWDRDLGPGEGAGRGSPAPVPDSGPQLGPKLRQEGLSTEQSTGGRDSRPESGQRLSGRE